CCLKPLSKVTPARFPASANATRGSPRSMSYFCQATGNVRACLPKTLGLVANRKNPCCVRRQKKQTASFGRPSNHVFAFGWWTCESKASASQTLMSGRSIFFVQDLRDARAVQRDAAGLIRSDQWDLNSSLFRRLGFGRRQVRNGHGSAFGQRRIAF